jgi:choline monooxygenase
VSWTFEPRLERASTLPSRFYIEPAVLGDEQTRVFGRTWQLAAHAGSVREPGQYLTTTIGREPVLIVRGNDGVLRAMSNVCRHRAGPVAGGAGQKKVLQCGYHGWTYALDGSLLATPELQSIECFVREDVRLPQFRIERWNDLLFVALDAAAPPFREFLGAMAGEEERSGHQGFRLAARKEWELDCNWKVYVDNYLEGYHIPIVHPSLFRELDYANYRTETQRFFSIQHAPLRHAERIRGNDDVRYYWLFPNLMLNVYPDNFSTNLIVPLGAHRTLTIFEWYFRDPDASRQAIEETVAFSDEIQVEDIAICEAVQRGLQSSTYDTGRYSPARENGVHHFHQLYVEFMEAGSAEEAR